MTLDGGFGAAAVVLTTAGWVPQIRRALKTRSAADFSLGWLLLFGSGVTSWFVYGLLRHDGAIIIANALAMVALGILLVIHRMSARTPAVVSEPEPSDVAAPH